MVFVRNDKVSCFAEGKQAVRAMWVHAKEQHLWVPQQPRMSVCLHRVAAWWVDLPSASGFDWSVEVHVEVVWPRLLWGGETPLVTVAEACKFWLHYLHLKIEYLGPGWLGTKIGPSGLGWTSLGHALINPYVSTIKQHIAQPTFKCRPWLKYKLGRWGSIPFVYKYRRLLFYYLSSPRSNSKLRISHQTKFWLAAAFLFQMALSPQEVVS